MTISFVIPFYKKAALFRQMLPVTDVFRLDDVELILVLDHAEDEPEVLRTVAEHSGIKFRVIVNDWAHAWRPPCMAINVGIRWARANHVAVMSPETALVLPRPNYLHDLLRRDWRSMYSGLLWNIPDVQSEDDPDLVKNKMVTVEYTRRPSHTGHGFIMVQRFALERICAYDERWAGWGLEDDDIRWRLIRSGIDFRLDGNIKAFHVWHESVERHRSSFQDNKASVVLHEQEETWGRSFNRIAHDWQ